MTEQIFSLVEISRWNLYRVNGSVNPATTAIII